MVYRQISLARVMRKIAIGRYENIYFQEKNGTMDLRRFKDFEFKAEEFKKYIFFELEK